MTEQLQGELARCPAGMAARLVGVSQQTLRAWAKAGKIVAFKGAGGRYAYDVRPFVQKAEVA